MRDYENEALLALVIGLALIVTNLSMYFQAGPMDVKQYWATLIGGFLCLWYGHVLHKKHLKQNNKNQK